MRWPSTTTVMSGRTGDPVASITFTCLKARMGSEAEEEATMVASERITRKTLTKALCMATSSDWQIREKIESDLRNKMVPRIGDPDAPLKELERETQADFKRAWNALGEYARSQTIAVGTRPRRGCRAVYRTGASIQHSSERTGDKSGRGIEVSFVRDVIDVESRLKCDLFAKSAPQLTQVNGVT